MSAKLIVGAVLVLLIVVGGIFVIIAVTSGDKTNGQEGTAPAPIALRLADTGADQH
jgi:hypothetical protein